MRRWITNKALTCTDKQLAEFTDSKFDWIHSFIDVWELAVEKFALEANASPGLICF